MRAWWLAIAAFMLFFLLIGLRRGLPAPKPRGLKAPVLADGGVGLCPITRPIYCPEFGICVFETCP